jgi:Trp operon repressor
MARPEVEFTSDDEELQYAVKALTKAGITVQQLEGIRALKSTGGTGGPYNREMLGLRRWMVQELLAARLSNRQIANVLKVSKETVNADRHFNRDLYTQEILKNQDVHRARLLKEQMELKDMALQAFEESKTKRVLTTGTNGQNDSSMTKIEEGPGDASFLNVAKNSLVEQAKLLGLNEPRPVEQQDNTYRKFLTDLSQTIEKEREAKATDERRSNALPAKASVVSFEPDNETEAWPDAIPLETINENDY